jgi:hypothetical protein
MTDGTDGSELLARANREWQVSPPLAGQLPVRYPSGCVLRCLSLKCPRCKSVIPDGLARGRIARPLPDVIAGEGWLACTACDLLSPFSFRVRDGLVIEARRDGIWQRWEPVRSVSLAVTVRRWLGLGRQPAASGLARALETAAAGGSTAASGILRTGWAAALEVELAQLGWRSLSASGSVASGDVVRLRGEHDGQPAWIGVSLCSAAPDGCAEFGPLAWQETAAHAADSERK